MLFVRLAQPWATCLFVFSGLVAFPSMSWAADTRQPTSELVQAHLDAGEFGPAQQLARQAQVPAERDTLWRMIATAQANAGMFQAALETTHAIVDDHARSDVLLDLAEVPEQRSGARGGAALADFETLIELIESTIAPDSWETVGGPGAVEPFPGGVFVDATGLMRRLTPESVATLSDLRARAAASKTDSRDARRPSELRKISLSRLERHLQTRDAAGRPPSDVMLNLAGLHRIQYVFVYPETRDIVLAGPAGDWTTDGEGRAISLTDGAPIIQLDDFIVLLRNAFNQHGRFGCSITPRQENLASVQQYLQETGQTPLKPHQRDNWLNGLRTRLGRQDISVFGIDPSTRAAHVLVEADYHMKLVGIGLEPGTRGVTSYLDTVTITAGGEPLPLDVLRWWFTLNYEALRTTSERNAFAWRGTGVKVLSENELLTERGERVHTGTSTEPNHQFAHSFTAHFNDLATKYPVYAELRNIFDLALVAAILRSEDLPDQVGWQMKYLLPPEKYQVGKRTSPKQVETVLNYRLVNAKHLIVGVSGGVSVDTTSLLQTRPFALDEYGLLQGDRANSDRANSTPAESQTDWWWD